MDNIPIAQKKLQILQFVPLFHRVRQKITCTASRTTFEELNPNFFILEMEGGGLPIPPSIACFEIIGFVTGIDYALKTVIERDKSTALLSERDRISISALKFFELDLVDFGLSLLSFWACWGFLDLDFIQMVGATSRSESVFFCAFLLVSFDWLRLMGILILEISEFRVGKIWTPHLKLP